MFIYYSCRAVHFTNTWSQKGPGVEIQCSDVCLSLIQKFTGLYLSEKIVSAKFIGVSIKILEVEEQ